ncbi:MAG: hypothetical protein IJQ62_11710 [Clostridia bacterium]|nr:hypothetical protein [Clostridia bacterium]
MFKLMKYEFRKTWITKLILLGVTAALEIMFLIALYGEFEDTLILSVGLLTAVAMLGVLVIGLESVLTLHRDMNTKQSYMLFMTPNSSNKILGAKVLECSLSILITGAFFFALGALDITLLFAKSGTLNQLWDMIQDFLSHFSVAGHELTFDTATMAALVFNLLTGWIGTVTMAYLADVVSSALLNGKKFNGLLSFALFLFLSWFTGWITRQATAAITSAMTMLLVDGLISLAFAAIMYIVTAQIMERKLSV